MIQITDTSGTVYTVNSIKAAMDVYQLLSEEGTGFTVVFD